MADSSGIQVLVEAAEHAASVGDWSSAEERLRRVAAVQTEQLGPGHTDLAYTLNNLGVVCERTGKPDEAEQFYGRAYAIAAAALPLDDPLVVTSGQNFRELSASRGKPLDSTPSAPASPPPIEPRVESERASSTTVDVSFRSHSSTTGIAVIVGIAIAAFIGWYFWSGPGESVDSAQSRAVVETEAPAVVETEAQAVPTPAVAAAAAPESPNITESRPAVPLKPRAASAPVSVVVAQLCRALSTTDWRCAPASPPTAPGSLYFYTRLQSPLPATVEHRWYYEERLVQTVRLEISANQGPGYRTYSRQTIGAERSGNWRVELRSQDGGVLHEERFVVSR